VSVLLSSILVHIAGRKVRDTQKTWFETGKSQVTKDHDPRMYAQSSGYAVRTLSWCERMLCSFDIHASRAQGTHRNGRTDCRIYVLLWHQKSAKLPKACRHLSCSCTRSSTTISSLTASRVLIAMPSHVKYGAFRLVNVDKIPSPSAPPSSFFLCPLSSIWIARWTCTSQST
jgi:hypothetical protein